MDGSHICGIDLPRWSAAFGLKTNVAPGSNAPAIKLSCQHSCPSLVSSRVSSNPRIMYDCTFESSLSATLPTSRAPTFSQNNSAVIGDAIPPSTGLTSLNRLANSLHCFALFSAKHLHGEHSLSTWPHHSTLTRLSVHGHQHNATSNKQYTARRHNFSSTLTPETTMYTHGGHIPSLCLHRRYYHS